MSTDLRQVRVLDADASADDVAAVLADDGCVSVAELVSRQVMDDIHREMAPYIEATPMGPVSPDSSSTVINGHSTSSLSPPATKSSATSCGR